MADQRFVGRHRRDHISKNSPQGFVLHPVPDFGGGGMGIDGGNIMR